MKILFTMLLATAAICHAQPSADDAAMQQLLEAVAKDPALMKLIGATNRDDVVAVPIITRTNIEHTTNLFGTFSMTNLYYVATNFEPARSIRTVELVDDWATRFEESTNWVRIPGPEPKWYPQVISNVTAYVVFKGKTNRVVLESTTNDWLRLDLIRTGVKPLGFPPLTPAPKEKEPVKQQPLPDEDEKPIETKVS
jgi:hypothetical protein